MQFANLDDTHFLVRLEKGEDIITTLYTFATEHAIKNASFSGIGSIENPTLAHYQVDNKKYTEKAFEGTFEVTSLQGNIAVLKEDIIMHPHITLSDENMQAFGGHLVKGLVSATMEIIITVFQTEYVKEYDETIGLKLWQLKK